MVTAAAGGRCCGTVSVCVCVVVTGAAATGVGAAMIVVVELRERLFLLQEGLSVCAEGEERR